MWRRPSCERRPSKEAPGSGEGGALLSAGLVWFRWLADEVLKRAGGRSVKKECWPKGHQASGYATCELRAEREGSSAGACMIEPSPPGACRSFSILLRGIAFLVLARPAAVWGCSFARRHACVVAWVLPWLRACCRRDFPSWVTTPDQQHAPVSSFHS